MEQGAYKHAFALERPDLHIGAASMDWDETVVRVMITGSSSFDDQYALRLLVLLW